MIEIGALTASGYDEIIATFEFKGVAERWLRHEYPGNVGSRFARYEVVSRASVAHPKKALDS